MAGLLSVGQSYKNNAMRGLSTAAQLEQRRADTEDQLDAADKAQEKSNMGMGAGLGYMARGSIASGLSGLAGGGAAASGAGITTAAGAGAAGTMAGTSAGVGGAAATGAAGAAAGAEAGGMMGAWAGPLGILAGAGLGFLFSRLF